MTGKYSAIINKMIWLGEQNRKSGEVGSRAWNINTFVTVSRDPGSGGKPIAKMLAKALGFKFFDQTIINQIAKSVDARKEILEQVDEKDRSNIEDFVHSILNPEYISERRYITQLCKVVLSLAHTHKAVFLGRGTNFILPRHKGLNVRITAPYRVCVARAVEYEGVSHTRAREIIRDVTDERAAFVKQYFGKDINNPKYYDVTLNTAGYDLSKSVKILERAFWEKFTRK